jgi:bifunctional N-acetylglucosamine-1-phosphate-uridyltransferase/glucosamine-1-phosphate-acetyltransferase GlmU-like protein
MISIEKIQKNKARREAMAAKDNAAQAIRDAKNAPAHDALMKTINSGLAYFRSPEFSRLCEADREIAEKNEFARVEAYKAEIIEKKKAGKIEVRPAASLANILGR